MGLFDSIKDIVSPVADFIAPGFGSIVGGIGGMIGQGQTNKANARLVEAQNAAMLQNTRETNFANQEIAQRANQAAAEQAAIAMQFSERMSNTAYQRSVSDMRSAGINPMMAAINGGASSPAGVAAPVQMARMERPEVNRPQYDSPLSRMSQQIGSGLSSALDWQRKDRDMFHADLGNKQAAALHTLASVSNVAMDTANKTVNNEYLNNTLDARSRAAVLENYKTEAQTALATQETINKKIDQMIKEYGVFSAKSEAKRAETDFAFYDSDIGKAMRALGLSGEGIESIKKSIETGKTAILPKWLR